MIHWFQLLLKIWNKFALFEICNKSFVVFHVFMKKLEQQTNEAKTFLDGPQALSNQTSLFISVCLELKIYKILLPVKTIRAYHTKPLSYKTISIPQIVDNCTYFL